MAVQSLDHPDPARLDAFGRGTLDHDEMAQVERHLAVCASCCQVLSTLPADEFVGLLRKAQNHLDLDTSLRCIAKSSSTPSETLDVPDSEVASWFVPPGLHSFSKLGETLSAGNLNCSETPERHPEWRFPRSLRTIRATGS